MLPLNKVDHKEMNTEPNQSSVPKSDLFELVWENGQISMQGQSSSNRDKKSPTCKNFPSHTLKGHDQDSGQHANETNTGKGKFEDLDNGLNVDLMMMTPLLNYAMDGHSSGYSVAAEEFDTSGLKTRDNKLHENDTKSNANYQNASCEKISHIPSSSPIMNFTHFAKPVAIVKAHLQNFGLSSSRSESVGEKNKGAVTVGMNPLESTKVDLIGEGPRKLVLHEPSGVDLKPLEPKSLEQALGESGRKDQEAVEKCIEQTVVSSSACSDNGACRGSDYANRNLKRKNLDSEDSEWLSEDLEDESIGAKKTAHERGVMGSKRNRSAEVHNLSERRRRNRINEKMRTLQELIPNCNKADKASMLDEAIEYLKTLQLQLQIMSMGGGGLYMPMMPHMSPFSLSPMMSIGMQMGLGVHTSELSALHGWATRPNPEMFGLPGQGFNMTMPCAPMFTYPGESVINPSAVGLNTSVTAGLREIVESTSVPKLKDPMQNVNSQVTQNNNVCNSTNHMSIQREATIGGLEQSNLVRDLGHASLTNDKGAFLGKEDNLVNGDS